MPPDDILERAPEDPPPADEPPGLALAWAPFPVEFGGTWWLDETGGEAGKPEPELAFAWAPFPVEFGASWWADPEHPAGPEEAPLPPRRRAPRLGLAGSLGVHLLPLLLLIGDTGAPPAVAGAIPVRLVIERPAAENAAEKAAPQEQVTPPRAPPPNTAAEAAQPKPAPPAKPPPRPLSAVPEPKPIPPAPNPPPQPKPVAVAAPVPVPAPGRPALAAVPSRSQAQAGGQRSAAASSPSPPAANQSDAESGSYLDYLVMLTRRHADMLSPAFLAGRHGETILSVAVREDGTIARIAVKHGSGYPDIDQRIAEMVAAVGRFPPPPQRFRRADLDLDFKLIFPYAVQQ